MSKASEKNNIKDWYISAFKELEGKLNGESKTFLHEKRKNALETLAGIDFPTLKNEEWKYTNVKPILNHTFIPAYSVKQSERKDISKFLFTGFESHLLVFVNGVFNEKLSAIDKLPKGVVVDTLKNVVKNNPELIKNYVNSLQDSSNAFNMLNSVYSFDGLVVVVPDGKVVEKPIQVLYLNGDKEKEFLVTPKNLVVAGKNSRISIIVNFQGEYKTSYFTNSVTEIFADEYAIVNFYKIQQENENAYHIEKVDAVQKRNSNVSHYSFSFGGSIVRNDINSKLDDENIECHYYGLYLGKNKQHIDNHTFIDHAKPNCMSNELYKGILDNEAHGVFNGKIMVRQDAQKTNAYQSNKTVLLSKEAGIDTKPQLEIFADDVKCSHGATVGHLDDTAFFYIRSRGIPDNIAKSMLIRAFASDVVENVKIAPLKDQINHLIFEHLKRVEI